MWKRTSGYRWRWPTPSDAVLAVLLLPLLLMWALLLLVFYVPGAVVSNCVRFITWLSEALDA